MFPTAIHVAVAHGDQERADSRRCERLRDVLADKARQWDKIIKIGRTHLADATPLRLGQEFGGFARQLELSIERAKRAIEAVLRTARRRHGRRHRHQHASRVRRQAWPKCWPRKPAFRSSKRSIISKANAQRDGLVECHGQLRTIAVTLFNVANNIRWLGSGPRCGFYEVKLPDRQPGRSIMPGKVNPVMCESMMQVCARVMGNDQTRRLLRRDRRAVSAQHHDAGHGPRGAGKRAACWPAPTRAFVDFCAVEMEANREACEASVEKSLAMVTSLNPHIGYERAAALAKEAFKTGKTIRELCREQKILPENVLNEALDPWSMTEPH